MRFIYGLCDKITGVIRYIGQTGSLKKRFYVHLKEARDGVITYKNNWIRSIDLNIEMIVLDECETYEESNYLEKFWISYLEYLGFSLTNSHVTDSNSLSKETRKKIASYPKTKETKDKISNTLKEYFKDKENHWAYNKEMSDDHVMKLHNSHKNNHKNVGNRNKRTEEEKKNLSLIQTGKKVVKHYIEQYDNNHLIKIWDSKKQIMRELRINIQTLNKYLDSERKYLNFLWKTGKQI